MKEKFKELLEEIDAAADMSGGRYLEILLDIRKKLRKILTDNNIIDKNEVTKVYKLWVNTQNGAGSTEDPARLGRMFKDGYEVYEIEAATKEEAERKAALRWADEYKAYTKYVKVSLELGTVEEHNYYTTVYAKTEEEANELAICKAKNRIVGMGNGIRFD